MSTEYFNDQWRIPNNKNQSLVSNYSMEFDGTNDVVNCGLNAPFNAASTNFSISLWCKSPNSFTDSGNLVESRLSYANPDGIAIEFISNTMYFRKSGSTVNKTITEWGLNNTNWNHILYTYDLTLAGNKIFVYINGVLLSSTPQAATSQPASTGDFTIGDGLRGNFNGSIDQVSVFDYTLSASQVATLYGGGTAVTNPMSLSPKPISYYQLGEQSVDNGANYLVPNNSLQDYVFNFANSRITIANGSTIARQQNISYSAWVKSTSLSATSYIVGNNTSSNKGTSVFLLNDVLVFQIGDGSNDSYFNSRVSSLSNYVNANDWFHVAASWDGTDSKIYINGVERNSWTPSQPYTITGWSANFDIGEKAEGFGSYFSGELSNVAFWDSGLTPTQVETIYNNGSPNDISSLSPVGWWKLNAADTFDGTNWTITDYAGSNDGTSSGMTSANLVQSNLQQTSGYSPYALSLDSNVENYFILNNGNGNGLLNAATSFTISAWINPNQPTLFGTIFSHFTGGVMLRFTTDGTIQLYVTKEDNSFSNTTAPSALTFSNNWQHVVATYDGSFLRIYVNNVLVNTPFAFSDTLKNDTSSSSDNIGNRAGGNPNQSQYFDGEISNVAVWKNTVINVTTLYNQGIPADLTSLNPSGWWQMGSNSSFDASTSKWTCLNEGTTRTSAVPSNATTFAGNMTNDDITNGVGYSGNGLGTSSIDIKGDAPYSSANGISQGGMDVLDRTTDVPS